MVTVLPSHYQITMKSSLSLALQVAKPQGKLKNSGVSSLSLLQRIFKAQESNWGLLHYRWILYQLSYQGSPMNREEVVKENEYM